MRYIYFSDFHAHNFSEFSTPDAKFGTSRLRHQVEVLEYLFKQAKDTSSVLLFGGDLFHQRNSVDTRVFNAVFGVFARYSDVTVVMIRGNHDSVNNSITSPSSIEPFEELPNVSVVTGCEVKKVGTDTITCISYGDEVEDMKKFIKDHPATLLMAHIGVDGSRSGAYSHSLGGAFTKADLYNNNYQAVLLGHYHERQMLFQNGGYVGNTVPMSFNDDGETKGYWTFETSDSGKTLKNDISYVPIASPKFMTLDLQNLPDDYEDVVKHNFVRVRGTKKQVDKLSLALTTDDTEKDQLESNLRMEVIPEAVTENRLDLKTTANPVEITSTWAKKFMPDKETLLVSLIKSVM